MLRKYAALDVLDAQMATTRGLTMARTAHRVSFEYTPRPGYLYVRSRMISSRCNDNFDEFPADQIKLGWKTFLGKPVFVNHHNEDHRKARGVIIDAALHEDRNPDGSPDTWVEGLMEIDAVKFPKLANALLNKHIERTSMGVDVDYSVCSKCANKAMTPLDYCQHIPTMKGIKAATKTASGVVRNEPIRERCYGLRFFENSLLVEDPADPTAYFLGNVESGPGLEHLSARTAKAKQFDHDHFDSDTKSNSSGTTCSRWHCDNKAVATHSLGGKTLNVCSTHKNEMDSSKESALATMKTGAMCRACFGVDTLTFQGSTECLDCGSIDGPAARTASRETPLANMQRTAGNYSFDMRDIPSNKNREESQKWKADPGSHPIWHDIGAHMDHIIHHYDQATPQEHHDGMRWYEDAHLLAHHLGKSTGHGTSTAAGVLSATSPKMEWGGNNINYATRALHEGKGVEMGKDTPGLMDSHTVAQNKILGGMHHQEALGGPKTQNFAHNIEHAGKDPETGHDTNRVTVDTHAVSVMCNRRLSKDEKADVNTALGKHHFYQHANDMYVKAAKHISDRDGTHVSPTQMQAITWGVRKRMNDEDPDYKNRKALQTNERNNLQRRRDYQDTLPAEHNEYKNHSSDGSGRNLHANRQRGNSATGSRLPFAGLSRTGYGETKAPPDVDTLRDEECPICGEQDAYDGTECKVCGYVEPPKQFQDPNVDLAKQLDLRKDTSDPAQMNGQDIGHLEDAIADPNRDGLDDETGEPIDPNAPAGPTLSCPACGTEFPSEPPQSVETAPDQDAMLDDEQGPTQGDALDTEAPEDPTADPAMEPAAEGDVCPVCGKGVLVGTEEAEALGEEGPPATEGDPTEIGASDPEFGADPEEEPEDDSDESDSPFPPKDSDDDSDDDEEVDPNDDSDEDDDEPVDKSKNPFKK